MALPAGALPSGAAAPAPSSPTLLTTGFAGKVVSTAMVEGTKTPAPRLGFAPIARWKGRNRGQEGGWSRVYEGTPLGQPLVVEVPGRARFHIKLTLLRKSRLGIGGLCPPWIAQSEDT